MLVASRIVVLILFLISEGESIRLESGVHLFVDNQYIDELTSLEFQNGLVQKDLANPIVHPEYPWESAVHFYTSFIQVPSSLSLTGQPTYMIYYACAPSYAVLFNYSVSVCVATSTNGINWTKPLLSYYPYTANGTEPPQNTNIVFQTSINEFLGSVFIDTKQGIPRVEIFKMTYENSSRYVYIATSPDGLKWTAGSGPANPVATLSDTQTSMFYSNENGGQYVLYGRHDAGIANSTQQCPGAGLDFRHVMVTVSSNGSYGPWTKPIEAFPLGPPDPIQCFDSYNPAALYYHDVYLLFPSGMLHWALKESGAPIPRAGANDGVMDIRLSYSRTALGPYQFVSRDSFISRGIGTIDPISKLVNGTGSDRDAGFVFASSNGLLDPDFVKTFNNDDSNPSHWIYHLYWGSQTTHAGGGAFLPRYWPHAYSGIFKAKLRREGYIALSTLATDPVGFGSFRTEILSLPQAIPNKELHLKLNAQIATAGSLNVQFEDGNTKDPIRGFTFKDFKTLHGNYIRQLVEFIREDNTTFSDLTPLANYERGVRIHIQMTHTKLYSWVFSYS